MNKIFKLLAAITAVFSIAFADTMVTDSLSVGGFVDMSYMDSDNGEESSSGIDQVEFNFTLDNGGPVSAQLDIEYENGNSTNVNVEEAYLNYALSSGGEVTVGRFETMLLQDASEPTGLYQYSNAYDFYGLNFNQSLNDVGDQGIKYSNAGFAISLVDNGDSKIGDGNTTGTDGDGDYAYEISYTGKLTDQIIGFIGGRFYEDDRNNKDGDILNLHLTYEEGPWVIGAEYVAADYDDANLLNLTDVNNLASSAASAIASSDLDLFSVFANYSYSVKDSVTVRYSSLDGDILDNGGVTYNLDAEKLTLAHNSALNDDLALILEYSMQESKYATDQDTLAVELLYAF